MKINGYRWLFYILGCLVLAMGLTLNTKAGLGVSPIISVSYCISYFTGISFGDMTLVLYCILVFVQILIHYAQKRNKRIYLFDILQIPLSIFFTRLLNIYSLFVLDFSQYNLVIRLLVLGLAIIFTGIGASLMMTTRIILNPGDGIVAALATLFQKDTGTTKNFFDLFMICLTCCIGYIWKRQIIGIGLGTVIAMLLTGRVIAIFNKTCRHKVLKLSNLVSQ